MAQPLEPRRSQSTTSLAKFYNGAPGNGIAGEELNDPRMDFCNSFWGQGDRGFEVIIARLRGAGRTVEELKVFWKERAAIEEDYAKRLSKLSKYSLGRDEVGDLAESLRNVLAETGAQASYHQALGTEIRQSVEQPTAEFGVRLSNLKKGLQGSVEKAQRNKGLQEGHVAKAKERYESDCLKLNSYSANAQLVQGKELDRLQGRLDKVRQTIGANEQEFRQFVRVLEGTTGKWEQEWRAFCDSVQDLEDDRLALTKDIIWAFANAVSQVCVEDDSSCERVREKLEQFEPQNDMVFFVKGWGTGDQIPDPPRFVNYSAGEYPSQPSSRSANFRRISSRPPPSAKSQQAPPQDRAPSPSPEPEPEPEPPRPQQQTNGYGSSNTHDMQNDPQSARSPPPPEAPDKKPFGGVALPGMAAVAAPIMAVVAAPIALAGAITSALSPMGPPPVPPSMTMPEPRIPSRQGPPTPKVDVNDEEDPMAKALADLRRDPPPPNSVRRAPSSRRPESVYSGSGSVRGSAVGHDYKAPPSPAPNTNRMSYQQPPSQQSHASIDMTLSPPAAGHTAAALARSMDDFQRASSRGPEANRQSVNYSGFADDVVGAHPSSRPASPSGRAPSPAMMQAPVNPRSPVADEVLSQYHQAFPGERSRSRAGSVVSNRSRANSFTGPNQPPPPQQQQQQRPVSPSGQPRQAFAGIGAGGRSPSPQPPAFRSPSPSPVVHQGALGPQNLGIALDERGGVAYDSKAEEYRRQYQQQQQTQQTQQPQQQYGGQQPSQQYGGQQQQQYGQPRQQQYTGPKSPVSGSFSGMPPSISGNRPTSAYGSSQQHQQPQQQQPQHTGQGFRSPSPQPAYNAQPQQQYGQQPQRYQDQQQQYPSYGQSQYQHQPQQNPMSPGGGQQYTNGYQQQPQQQQSQAYGGNQQYQQNQYARSASPAPQSNQYARAASPAPPPQQQQSQQYGYRAPSPQPGYGSQQQHQQRGGRSPSPQPGVAPTNAAPTGQWSTTGLPVLFYVKALYDYTALSGAEFDFQAGDIIAVTSTPEDGWWSGELLDEARRIPGRNDFPSNFVCLF